MTPTPAHVPAAPEPLHGCVRCGAKIPISESMCERCNPLGLKAPAASQAHGFAIAFVAAAVVVLAVIARLAINDVGPFTASVATIEPAPSGLHVTISVTNEGHAAGRSTCSIADPTKPGLGPETAFVESPLVQPGQTLTFDATVLSLGTTPRPLDVACGT